MDEQRKIVVENLEKVIYNPCRRLVLKHVITLGSKDKNKRRKDEYSLYQYRSEKYSDQPKLARLTAYSSEYLVLEDTDHEKDLSYYMSYKHIIIFKKFIKNCIDWFNKYDDIIVENKNGDLVFNNKYNNLEETSEYFLNGLRLHAMPDLIEDEEEYSEGILLFLTKDDYYNMTLMELEALYDFLSTFNLYQCTLTLIEYYNSLMNRPDIEFTFKSKDGEYKRKRVKPLKNRKEKNEDGKKEVDT